MKYFDDKNQNDSLLSGSFRNEELDLEFRILMSYSSSQDDLLDAVRICFSAPKLNIEIPRGTKIDLKTDGSGYGIAKLKDDLFLRLAWSMDPKRKMHSQIIRTASGQPEILLDFESSAINSMEKNNLKRCLAKTQP